MAAPGVAKLLLSSEVIETGHRLEPAFVYQRRPPSLSDPRPTQACSGVQCRVCVAKCARPLRMLHLPLSFSFIAETGAKNDETGSLNLRLASVNCATAEGRGISMGSRWLDLGRGPAVPQSLTSPK
jgi:hypothetical protein